MKCLKIWFFFLCYSHITNFALYIQMSCMPSVDFGNYVTLTIHCWYQAVYCSFGLLFRYYNSLPPVSKAYGTLCLLTTAAVQLGLLDVSFIALYYPWVFYRFQVCVNVTFRFLKLIFLLHQFCYIAESLLARS